MWCLCSLHLPSHKLQQKWVSSWIDHCSTSEDASLHLCLTLLAGLIQHWAVALVYIVLELCVPAVLYTALSFTVSVHSILVRDPLKLHEMELQVM